MHINNSTQNRAWFKANPIIASAAFSDGRVPLNKVLPDASCDAPMVLMANNKNK